MSPPPDRPSQSGGESHDNVPQRPPVILRSIAAAFGLLTAVPFPGLRKMILDEHDLRKGTAWYSVVGLFIALVTILCAEVSRLLGASTEILALVVLAVPLLITKFFHFDGLSDVLDAFLARKDPVRTREIMKDSRVGSYALGGGALYLLARWVLLTVWARTGISWWLLLGCLPLSRAFAVFIAGISKPAAGSSLGAGIVGKVPTGAAFATGLISLASMFAAALCGEAYWRNAVLIDPEAVLRAKANGADFFALGDYGNHIFFMNGPFFYAVLFLIMTAFGFAAAILLRSWANKKIGGVNGDVLGAVIELSELACIAGILGGTSWLVRI